jgi:hypothetical protein
MTGGDLGSRPGSMGGALPVAGATGGPLSAESWSLSSQFGHKGAVKAIGDAYDQTLPKIPDPPGKVSGGGEGEGGVCNSEEEGQCARLGEELVAV